MTKKKKPRQKHQEDFNSRDTSDDEQIVQNCLGCPHVLKAVNLGGVKKALKNNNTEECLACRKNETSNILEADELVESEEVWLCLQCGHCGCGRSSPAKHAILHQQTPHSDCHAMVLNTTSRCVWCYECDDEVGIQAYRRLAECVDFIMKSSKTRKSKLPQNATLNHAKITNDQTASEKLPETVSNTSSGHTLCASKLKNACTEPRKITDNQKQHDSRNVKPMIKGLRNLGNTCFFNAVMQNLSQTPWLLQELETRCGKGYTWNIPYPTLEKNDTCNSTEEITPLKINLLSYYPLTQALLNFLKEMHIFSKSSKADIINPGPLFEQICKKSPQFRGFQQQDSHELLRHLLDGIRNEEIKRQKRGILNAFNLSEKSNPNKVDERTKKLVKAYGIYASHTFVESIFSGQLLSTVLCEECHMSSQVFEQFMDLSLPLAEEKPIRPGKDQKHANSEDCNLKAFSKFHNQKEGEIKLNKYQERKMKRQARKTAKKQAKVTKSAILSIDNETGEMTKSAILSIDNETGETASNSMEQNDNGEKQDSDVDLSDADVEDNEDSESISSKMSGKTYEPQTENSPKVSVTQFTESYNGIVDHSSALDDRIEELCSQITDIRIRRDSENHNNILELDSHENCVFNQEATAQSSKANGFCDEINGENWTHSQFEHLKKEWMLRSLTTVKPRYQPSSHECSVKSCLNQFTASEWLTGSNKFRCENCTNLRREKTGCKSEVVYSNASKQLLIFSPPAILTLHLKRFQQTGMNLRKLNLCVEFPLELDLAPYCSSVCLRLPHMAGVKDEILYSLYGVVEHSGRLTSGHYTAYVKLNTRQCNPTFLNSWPMGQCSLEQLLEKISKVKPTSYDITESIPNDVKQKWYYVSDGHFNEVDEARVLRCQAYLLFYQRIK